LNYIKIPKIQVLQKEKDSLGLFISANPLDEYKPILDYTRQILGRDNIHLVLLNKIKKIFTKSGVMMLALNLTSPEYLENVEGIIFPKLAGEYSPVLKETEIYWMIARPTKKEKTESENKEYNEGVKFGVESMSEFTLGPASCLHKIGLDISLNLKEAFSFLDFNNLQNTPENFSKQLKSIKTKKSLSYTIDISKTYTENSLDESLNDKQSNSYTLAKPKIYQLKVDLGVDIKYLKLFKQGLMPFEHNLAKNSLVFELILETVQGPRKVKGLYQMSVSDLDYWQKKLPANLIKI